MCQHTAQQPAAVLSGHIAAHLLVLTEMIGTPWQILQQQCTRCSDEGMRFVDVHGRLASISCSVAGLHKPHHVKHVGLTAVS